MWASRRPSADAHTQHQIDGQHSLIPPHPLPPVTRETLTGVRLFMVPVGRGSAGKEGHDAQSKKWGNGNRQGNSEATPRTPRRLRRRDEAINRIGRAQFAGSHVAWG